jgi:hypothetical protein
METMNNSKIVFLDTEIVNTDGKLHLEMYRKPASSENLINFKTAVIKFLHLLEKFTGVTTPHLHLRPSSGH